MADLAEKRQRIKDLVVKVFDKIDDTGENSQKFAEFIDSLSDNKFKDWMKKLKNGEAKLTIEMPNMSKQLNMDRLYEAADMTGTRLFQHLRMTDPETGSDYVTNNPYPVLQLPIRRTQQAIEKKMSLPESDKTIDAMTGQVTGPDKGSSVGKEVIQILYNKGLTNTLKEMLQIRGGNPELYSEFAHELEETGQANIDTEDPEDRTRVAQMADIMLTGMHLDSNL